MAILFSEADKFIGVQAIKLLNVFGPTPKLNILTDAAIVGLTTVAGLRAVITTAYANGAIGPNEIALAREVLATITRLEHYGESTIGANDGLFNSTNIAAANTFAGIISIISTALGLPDETTLDSVLRADGGFTLSGNYTVTDLL